MPLYRYKCTDGHVFDTIQKVENVAQTRDCKCGKSATRAPMGNSISVTEHIDTGLNGKAFDRPADIERIMAEREIIHDANQDVGDWDENDFISLDD